MARCTILLQCFDMFCIRIVYVIETLINNSGENRMLKHVHKFMVQTTAILNLQPAQMSAPLPLAAAFHSVVVLVNTLITVCKFKPQFKSSFFNALI